jgi:D-alanine-D-alanine ligase
VFLLAFHGGAGEDGTVQRALETRGLAFTGSGSTASAHAFDKAVAKSIVREHGVAVASATVLPVGEESRVREAMRSLLAEHGRIVAKPVADGSSVGLHHVQSDADVAQASSAIARADVPYLAEAFVEGTELTVGIVDMGEGPRALCASEVRLDPGRAFDYEGKYLGRGTVELTPAHVSEAVSTAARDVALTAHRALGCRGYSRTDVIVGAKGPVFLETNTLPGLTRASFVPQQLAHAGIPMRAFLDAQLALARR